MTKDPKTQIQVMSQGRADRTEAWAMAVEVNAEQQRTLARLRRQNQCLREQWAAMVACLGLVADAPGVPPHLRGRIARLLTGQGQEGNG